VSQHHHGAEQQGGRVGLALTSNIGSGTVDGLENGALVTNVTRGGKTQTTNQTSAHVGENVTVQVGHDKNLVVVGKRVGNHLQAGVVEQLRLELNTGELLGDLLANLEEETVGHLHDGSLVDNADLVAADLLGVLESESDDALTGLASDEFDALNDTIDNDVLNTRVFTLGVLADQDSVDTVVWGLVASDGSAGTQVGKEVEGSSECKVKGDVTLANRSLDKSVSFVLVSAFHARLLNRKPTARGPLRATLFLWMLSMVSAGMVCLPSTSTGVTSTGSQETGAYKVA
jgi:hypothetical protein